MNLFVVLRHVLLALPFGNSLVRALDGIVQAANAWAAVQHNADGTHAAVTATSVTVAGALTAKICSTDSSAILTIDVTTAGTIIAPASRAGFIRVTMSAGPTRVDGIDTTNYRVGDEVKLANASDNGGATGDNLTLRLQSTTAFSDYKFRGNPGLPNSDVVLPCGRHVVLILDKNSSGVRTYWRVSMF